MQSLTAHAQQTQCNSSHNRCLSRHAPTVPAAECLKALLHTAVLCSASPHLQHGRHQPLNALHALHRLAQSGTQRRIWLPSIAQSCQEVCQAITCDAQRVQRVAHRRLPAIFVSGHTCLCSTRPGLMLSWGVKRQYPFGRVSGKSGTAGPEVQEKHAHFS